MKNTSIFFCLTLFVFSYIDASPSVVIVGGGPTGLASAIQAHLLEAEVTVIEKRNVYTRKNLLFLHESSLSLLEKWQIEVPGMLILDLKGQRKGFVLIKYLEEALAQKARELGITFLEGEFENFVTNEKALSIFTSQERILLPYDVAIGADGIHSSVREKLGIDCFLQGEAIGAMAVIPGIHPPGKVDVERKDTSDFFAKNIQTPSTNIILTQNHPDTPISQLSQKELVNLCLMANWNEEASLLERDILLLIDNIPIRLQQAARFSDKNQGVLLLGDAAGCTSFFEGQGVNTAMATSEFIADFIKNFESNPEFAYANFEQLMQETIGSVIQKNQYLFH